MCLPLGPRLRGNDAATRFDAHAHLFIGFNCRFQDEGASAAEVRETKWPGVSPAISISR